MVLSIMVLQPSLVAVLVIDMLDLRTITQEFSTCNYIE